MTRRQLLSRTAKITALAGLAYFVPSSVFAANAPSNKINIGCIGVGRMGLADIRDIMRLNDTQILAVCDVDSKRASYAKNLVEERYGSNKRSGRFKGCNAYKDYRDLLVRKDIDAVMIVTPDHWHALPAIAAARSGKDIFIQKPLTYTIEEGKLLCDAVKRYGRILQVGSQQRSDARFRFACELVRNGRIGKLHTVKVGFDLDVPGPIEPVMPVPKNLDYEMWLGPAPFTAYTENRVHPQSSYERPGWLRISDYCFGMITGWGSHHIDIAQWGMGLEKSGPLEIDGWAEYPKDGLWDVHLDFQIVYKYANDVTLICTGTNRTKSGVVFEGSDGWVHVDRGSIDSQPKSLLTSVIKPEEIHLYHSSDHKRNFIDCINTRQQTVAPVETGHRSCSACILGYISMNLDRKIKWDPDKETILNDQSAERMLSRPNRSPWVI